MEPTAVSERLRERVKRLRFAAPVAYVYNPLDYAWEPHRAYLERWARGRRRAVLLGMNPGPFGMAQTGVPFGEVSLVREWLGIEGPVSRPKREHPKRPVLGFGCPRSEVSGARLWGWARARFGTPERFFERFFVANYCPLAFMEAGGRNRTPDQLPAAEREPLFEACDEGLRGLVEALEPELVIGIGRFARERAERALAGRTRVEELLHPSPASPRANKGWALEAEKKLSELGLL